MQKIHITFISDDKHVIETAKKYLTFDTNRFQSSFLCKYIEEKKDLENYDLLVSPANSFGDIRGGIDHLYYDLLGQDKLQKEIWETLKSKHHGEIMIGQSCLIPLGNSRPKYLLLCPTMRIPENVENTNNAYYYTRAFLDHLLLLEDKNIRSVFCPIPCVGVGTMNPIKACQQMKDAFDAYSKQGKIFAVYGEDRKNYPNMKPNRILHNARILFDSKKK